MGICSATSVKQLEKLDQEIELKYINFNLSSLSIQQKINAMKQAQRLNNNLNLSYGLTSFSFHMYEYITQSRQTSLKLTLSQFFSQKNDFIQRCARFTKIQMLKPFIHIRFSNLKSLNISSFKLYNIENLQFMVAPNLQCIQLHNNMIVSMKPFGKVSYPQLSIITVYGNKLNQINSLNRGNFKKLQNYQIDSYAEQYEGWQQECSTQNMTNDYNFLLKMENVNLKKLYASRGKRILPIKSQILLRKLNPIVKLRIYSVSQHYARQMERFIQLDQEMD